MTENPGGSGSSAYPGPQGAAAGQPYPPYDPGTGYAPPPTTAYPQSPYPGQPPPVYGSSDPRSYLGPPAYPGGGYGVPPPPPGYQAAQTGWSGFAIAAFVTSLVPLIGIVAAVPLAIVALVKIAKSAQRGRGLAIAAIVISLLWWIGFIVFAVWFAGQTADRNSAGEIVEEGRIGFGDIRVGDCVDIPDPGGTGDIKTFELKGVPCTSAHNAQAIAVQSIDAASYPGTSALDDQSLESCAATLTTRVRETIGPGHYISYRLLPTEEIWNSDNGHRVVCFVTRDGFGDFSGSLISQ